MSKYSLEILLKLFYLILLCFAIIGGIEYCSLFKVLASPADPNAIDTDGDGIPDASDSTSSGVSQDPNQSTPNYQSQRFTCDPNSETLQYGSKGNKVMELHTYLTDLGFGPELEPEKIDGKFGPHTKNAVVAKRFFFICRRKSWS
jgi:Putative peptidoglycan binding domain